MVNRSISPDSSRCDSNNKKSYDGYTVTPRNESTHKNGSTRTNAPSIEIRYHFKPISSDDVSNSSNSSDCVASMDGMPNTVHETTVSTRRLEIGAKHHHHHHHPDRRTNGSYSKETKKRIGKLRTAFSSAMVFEEKKDDTEDRRVGWSARNHRGRSRTRSSFGDRSRTSIEEIVRRAKNRRSKLLGEDVNENGDDEVTMAAPMSYRAPRASQDSLARSNTRTSTHADPNHQRERTIPETPGGFVRPNNPPPGLPPPCFQKHYPKTDSLAPGNPPSLRPQLRGDRRFYAPVQSQLQPRLCRNSIPPPPLWMPSSPRPSLRKPLQPRNQRDGRNPSPHQPSFSGRRQLFLLPTTNEMIFLPDQLPSRSSQDAFTVPVIRSLRPKPGFDLHHTTKTPTRLPEKLHHHRSGEDDPLSVGVLAAASPDRQKAIIGERLYHRIRENEPDRAGRITGIILDSENSYELLNLLESPTETMRARIDMALHVLRDYQVPDT
eukprot:CAMPEP_0197175620 /NCGR_PEP_ID=MMETSP1423-20130617/1780_1 /TAXON_ID=476441 /ORGANISM="Pseudo-nitzschia heimii, Strain UNC1101" /LENGTH=490 /DNA_ID=CAMNT_0042624809 /DNA_START=167 /DNA_END=1639 /DNA_ORIENTATION=-